MRNGIVIFVLMCCVTFLGLNGFAQKWEVQSSIMLQPNFSKLPGNALNGWQVSGFYNLPSKDKFTFGAGLEFQGNSWANHLLIMLKLDYGFFEKGKWSADAQFQVGNGIALYRKESLSTFNAKFLVFGNYKTEKNTLWSVGTGLQFITTPEYEKFSSIYRAVNLPLVIRRKF